MNDEFANNSRNAACEGEAKMQPAAAPVPQPPPFPQGAQNRPINGSYPPPVLPAAKPPFEADRREFFLVLLAAALGVLVREWLFLPVQPGFSAILLAAAVYGTAVWYGTGNEKFRISAGWPFGAVTVLLLCCIGLFSNRMLSALNLTGVYLFLSLHIGAMFGRGGRGFFRDLWQSAFCAPFVSADAVFRTISSSPKIEKGTAWRRILPGMAASVPVAAVVLLLLVSADEAFEAAVSSMVGSIGETVWNILADLLIGCILAIFIFSAFYTARRKRRPQQARQAESAKRFSSDSAIAVTVIAVCSVIYCCFLVIQFNYLFSAVWGRLPTDTVYSAYARRGFFELTAVAAINLVLMLAAVCSRDHGSAAVRVSVSVLTVLTLALIASAFSKMVMYINVFGLTPLRVYTSWFMLLLAVVFLLLLLGCFHSGLYVGRAVTAAAAAMFLALNFSVPDAMIARVNTERHRENPAQQADVALFEKLGDESVLYLLTLAQSEETDTARSAKYLLHVRYDELEKLDWRSMNAASIRAKSLLQANKDLFLGVDSPAPGYTGDRWYFSAGFYE
ncbi:MAG: DUF4173 domain-containing protein [Firmicutes bacterium]|nr:DUF4173 domain-containing protein [Bacillota bacterium]